MCIAVQEEESPFREGIRDFTETFKNFKSIFCKTYYKRHIQRKGNFSKSHLQQILFFFFLNRDGHINIPKLKVIILYEQNNMSSIIIIIIIRAQQAKIFII